LPVIVSVLQPGRTKLKHLSGFPGPPIIAFDIGQLADAVPLQAAMQ
jgi:hypothetical protein